jgi:hypothetical protein
LSKINSKARSFAVSVANTRADTCEDSPEINCGLEQFSMTCAFVTR